MALNYITESTSYVTEFSKFCLNVSSPICFLFFRVTLRTSFVFYNLLYDRCYFV